MLTPRKSPLPTFLIIGAQKSGTRWLRSSLGKHPEIYTADKELEFFNGHFREGVRWYLDQFDGWAGEPIIGEATPGYMFWRERPHLQAARIDGLLSPVRLIAILRNPVDRARSAIIHHARRGALDTNLDVANWLSGLDPTKDPLGIISGGWYGSSLEPYFSRFGESLKVIIYDDVETDREAVYLAVCEHVGVTQKHVPGDLSKVVNSGEAQLQKENPDASILRMKQSIRRQLYSHFEDDIGRLEALTGFDLSRWREV